MISKEDLLKSDLRKDGLRTLLEKIESEILFKYEKGFNHIETYDITGTIYEKSVVKTLEQKGFKVELLDNNTSTSTISKSLSRGYHKISWEEDTKDGNDLKEIGIPAHNQNVYANYLSKLGEEIVKKGFIFKEDYPDKWIKTNEYVESSDKINNFKTIIKDFETFINKHYKSIENMKPENVEIMVFHDLDKMYNKERGGFIQIVPLIIHKTVS